MRVKYILVRIENELSSLMFHIVCSDHKPTQTHDMTVPEKKNIEYSLEKYYIYEKEQDSQKINQ